LVHRHFVNLPLSQPKKIEEKLSEPGNDYLSLNREPLLKGKAQYS